MALTEITAFSKFLTYSMGGAEASTLSLLRQQAAQGRRIRIVCAQEARFLGRRLTQVAIPSDWRREVIPDCLQLPRFSYLEYVLNRARLRRWFEGLKTDELWTYGLWAPAAMAAFAGPVRYFVRSETDLGIAGNYFQGPKRWLKHLYDATELPATATYRRDLRRAVLGSGARVVANSAYMARRAQQCLGVDAEVSLPPVDVRPMQERLQAEGVSPRWVVFVGDNVYKGLQVAREIAALAPDLEFRFFSRFVERPREEGNVCWMPWQSESWRVFSGARLVIVPSQWEEAYGRTAREAFLLGLPVLVSGIGGLPEAVDDRAAHIVDDYKNPEAWLDDIRRTLAQC